MASSIADDSGEFARLHPVGPQAAKALDLLCNNSQDMKEHHRHFITVKDRTRPVNPMGQEPNFGDQHDSIGLTRSIGYYSLSLEDPIKKPFHQGWLVGKGSDVLDKQSFKDSGGPPRGVDILLICPGKKTYGVASVHARISFHPQSGVLMLHGVRDDVPVEYQTHDGSRPVLLGSKGGHVFYQRSNTFTVGQLQYTLVFPKFSQENYSRFESKRNIMMGNCGLPLPHPGLSAVWQPHVEKKGPVVSYENVGHGQFGWISGAVECATGEPRAIKEQRPEDVRALQSIISEMEVGNLAKVKNIPGLLPTIDAWCEHEYDTICSKTPQKVFSSFPLALYDFGRVRWVDQSTQQILNFFRGPLEGLANLHNAGYMHRDVHMKNLFVMSLNPPQAVLGDYGKATKEQRSSFARLGPPPTCAPEIDVEGKRFYDNKIDIWSFGLAMAKALVEGQRLEARVTQAWHSGELQRLQSLATQGKLEREVVDLVSAMLAWDPARRPSASTALAYPCFSSGNPLRRPPSSAHEPDLPHKAGSSSHPLSREPHRSHQQYGHHQSSGQAVPGPQQFSGHHVRVHGKQGPQGFASRQVSDQVHHPQQQMFEPLLPPPGVPEPEPGGPVSRQWYKGSSTSEGKDAGSSSGQSHSEWVPLAKHYPSMPPYKGQ